MNKYAAGPGFVVTILLIWFMAGSFLIAGLVFGLLGPPYFVVRDYRRGTLGKSYLVYLAFYTAGMAWLVYKALEAKHML